ncbi:MAG TPA: kelch repeat-containing protein [Pyrinomonadaceae bacterium]|nr:kelch repeat-containing protein [Pyrinomonadaceae bacterium]
MNNRSGGWRNVITLIICTVVFTGMISAQTKLGADIVERPPHPSSVVGRTSTLAFPGLTELPSNLLPAWNTATVYPTTIVRYAFADNGEDFYLIGGVSNGTRVVNVNRYNTASGVWTPLAPLPAASEAPCAALFNGKIYSAQGDTGNNFYIYDITLNSWSTGPVVPVLTNRYGCAAGAAAGKVYIVGGSTTVSNSVQVYDIGTNTWSTGNAAPSGFILAGYTTIGSFLYVVGGFTGAGGVNLTTTNALNMTTGAWESGPTFTPARADFALANLGNRLYAIGGDVNGGTFFESTTAVDVLSGGSWTASPDPLPTARQGNNAGFNSIGVLGGEIWSTGGIIGQTFTFLNEHLNRANAPTAAGVSVSGRVVSANGLPISRALVTRVGSNGVVSSTRTSSFGYFAFHDVPAGQTYIFDVSAKGYSFVPRAVMIVESIADIDFIGQ